MFLRGHQDNRRQNVYIAAKFTLASQEQNSGAIPRFTIEFKFDTSQSFQEKPEEGDVPRAWRVMRNSCKDSCVNRSRLRDSFIFMARFDCTRVFPYTFSTSIFTKRRRLLKLKDDDAESKKLNTGLENYSTESFHCLSYLEFAHSRIERMKSEHLDEGLNFSSVSFPRNSFDILLQRSSQFVLD